MYFLQCKLFLCMLNMRSKRNFRPVTKYVIVIIYFFPTELSVKQYFWPVLMKVFLYPVVRSLSSSNGNLNQDFVQFTLCDLKFSQ
jgi:hypothetical protein